MKKHIWLIVLVIIIFLLIIIGGFIVSSLIHNKASLKMSRDIEQLKLANESLRLKTESVLSETEPIRANEVRKSRCAILANQINSKESIVTQPFLERMKPLNEEIKKLKNEKPNSGSFSPKELSILRQKIDLLREENDAINIEMEQAVDSLRKTPEMKILTDEVNNLLCA